MLLEEPDYREYGVSGVEHIMEFPVYEIIATCQMRHCVPALHACQPNGYLCGMFRHVVARLQAGTTHKNKTMSANAHAIVRLCLFGSRLGTNKAIFSVNVGAPDSHAVNQPAPVISKPNYLECCCEEILPAVLSSLRSGQGIERAGECRAVVVVLGEGGITATEGYLPHPA
ncbi:hypothetical protein J6590_003613 [Homalodisca vitripennis]|nr:hypothetical protein J6590_003613 [Homalodisca vitripennis]